MLDLVSGLTADDLVIASYRAVDRHSNSFLTGLCHGHTLGALLNAASAGRKPSPRRWCADQSDPLLNAERARQRATDQKMPQAPAAYRPQMVASLSYGLQALRNLLPDNTV